MANRIFVTDALKTGRLVRVMEDAVATDEGYYLVVPKKTQGDGAVMAVSRWIRQQLA
jgi:DNA-binding transcriptional LysR family regulator